MPVRRPSAGPWRTDLRSRREGLFRHQEAASSLRDRHAKAVAPVVIERKRILWTRVRCDGPRGRWSVSPTSGIGGACGVVIPPGEAPGGGRTAGFSREPRDRTPRASRYRMPRLCCARALPCSGRGARPPDGFRVLRNPRVPLASRKPRAASSRAWPCSAARREPPRRSNAVVLLPLPRACSVPLAGAPSAPQRLRRGQLAQRREGQLRDVRLRRIGSRRVGRRRVGGGRGGHRDRRARRQRPRQVVLRSPARPPGPRS